MNLQAYRGNDPFIFASYAHADEALVEPIFSRILEEGYRFWFDAGIDPGTEWDENIASHIENCGYLIAFISKNYLASENCKDELNYARDLNKKRLLVYLEDVTLPGGMAMRLNRLQAIFRHKYDDGEKFYKELFLADGISAFLGAPRPSAEKRHPAKEPSLPKKEDTSRQTTVTFTDGSTYTGTVNAQGTPHGKGTFRWPNGVVYEGEVKDGFFWGMGHIQYVDGSVYDGEFQRGNPNGRGTFRWPNGVVYEGEVKDGRFWGTGHIQYTDGSVYDGEFQSGNPHGRGTFRWPNGAVYEGEVQKGFCCGNGQTRYPDGAIYEGEFQNGVPHGKGSYRWPNGAVQKGIWTGGQFTQGL